MGAKSKTSGLPEVPEPQKRQKKLPAGKKTSKKFEETSDEPSGKTVGRAVRVQYGALPYRVTQASALEILLVTSRQTRRWIIPKGWPIKGLKPPKSAAREAYEEAGIRGTMGGKSIGAFSYAKRLDDNAGIIPCEVRVFAMRVKRQLATWPEASERQTRWFEPVQAMAAVTDKGLRHVIETFTKKNTAPKKTKTAKAPH